MTNRSTTGLSINPVPIYTRVYYRFITTLIHYAYSIWIIKNYYFNIITKWSLAIVPICI